MSFALVFWIAGNAFVIDRGLSAADCAAALAENTTAVVLIAGRPVNLNGSALTCEHEPSAE